MMEKKSKPRLHGAQHSSEILFGIVPLPTVWGHFIFVPLLPPHPPPQPSLSALFFFPMPTFHFPCYLYALTLPVAPLSSC